MGMEKMSGRSSCGGLKEERKGKGMDKEWTTRDGKLNWV